MAITTAAAGNTVLPTEEKTAQPSGDYKLSRATLSSLPATVTGPGFDPTQVTPGILHLGTGNFFLAHLGSYVNDLLAKDPRWGIVATSIRTEATIRRLQDQDGAYVLVVRQNGEREASVLAPIVETMFGPDDPLAIARRIADPNIKLVTVTVSNKGLCLKHGGLDLEDDEVRHDLAMPDQPKSIYGYIAAGLKLRRETGKPIVVMSLDNVEQNSKSLKKALLQFLEQTQSDLVEWVEANVDFPVTLVDRITPAVVDSFRRQISHDIGFDSTVLVGTEAFRQLVVERTRFEMPDWESVGVKVVDDCSTYWPLKFYLLNAGHQVAAIPGQRLGATYIHEVASRASVAALLARAHREWKSFLPGDRDELKAYCASIRQRFADEALNDTIQRVAARATSKVSERLFSSVEECLKATGQLIRVPIFVGAVWLFNLGREDEFGEHIHLHDADAEKLHPVHLDAMNAVRALKEGETLSAERARSILLGISDALKDPRFARLAANEDFVKEFAVSVTDIHRLGVEKAIDALLAR